METAAERQTEWARLIIESLVQAGVRDAVISPGSRSTPFVIAALQQEQLRCTSALDERSGAHFALGQARSTLRPTLLVCTSGSAPANYFPAVVEASEAGVPMIVLSADRPPELHQCGANQTTDQVQLYGRHPRFFAQLGEPRDDLLSLRSIRRLVAQAVSAATGARPGPVHLNAPARKPLAPGPVSDDLRSRVDAVLEEPLTRVHRARPVPPTLLEEVPPFVVDTVIEAFDAASRPIILCGPGDVRSGMFVDALEQLSTRAGAPVLAEATSQFRSWSGTRALGGFDTIWKTEAGRAVCLPDFVLQLGAAPISKGWELLATSHSMRRIVVHPWAWADPTSSAEAIIEADIGSFLAALGGASYEITNRDEGFVRRLARSEAIVWKAANEILDEVGDALTEGGVARTLFEALPDPSAVVLGNSLPVRDVETWTAPSKKLLVVHSQRGVSGIDGVVSGAAGVASTTEGPTTLLVGDVSFLHDHNGLQLGAGLEGPLVIVVINNGGGRIFEQLPIARRGDESWLPFFVTPHDADLASAAATYGCAHRSASTVSELRGALEAAYSAGGCSVIEARVPPHSARDQSAELIRRVEQALGREAV